VGHAGILGKDDAGFLVKRGQFTSHP
jgi:hypothetical protein